MRIGNSEHWPGTLRKFSREHRTHVVLDDVRGLGWGGRMQGRVQGVWYEELEFGTAQGCTCAYKKYLYRVPIVVTCCMPAAHLGHLDSPDADSAQTTTRIVH